MNHRTRMSSVISLLLLWFASMCPSYVAAGSDVANPSICTSSSEPIDCVAEPVEDLETEVVEALLEALQDENPAVRMNSLRSMRSIGCESKEAREALINLIKSEEVADVRDVAFDVLTSVISDQNLLNRVLTDFVTTAKRPEVRNAAVSAFGALPRSRGNLRILMRALKDTDSSVRASAAEALGNLKTQRHPHAGLDGYCPVTLLHAERWIRGNPKWSYEYRGLHYQFTSRSSRQDFINDPNRYAIVANGLDVVSLLDEEKKLPGVRAYGVVYRDHVYLFSSEKTLETFWSNPDRYASGVRRELREQSFE